MPFGIDMPSIPSFSDIGSSVKGFVSDSYSNVRDQTTLKNLAQVAPATLFLNSSGREQLMETYGPYLGAAQQFISGNPMGAIGTATNVLANNPDSPSWLGNLLGGGQQQAPQQPVQQGNQTLPIFLGNGNNSSMPSWLIPAAIGAGVLVLVLVMRK
jgi:hypothetical protein